MVGGGVGAGVGGGVGGGVVGGCWMIGGTGYIIAISPKFLSLVGKLPKTDDYNYGMGCPHFQTTPCDGKPTSLVVKPEMFVDEPHVKYGENYTPSTVHFNYGRPKRRKQTNNPI